MLCPQCKTPNREGRRYCGACGAPLALACDACGFVNEPGETFCGGCARALPAPTSGGAGAGAAAASERRQLTVMFCDLVGSTGLAEHLDPEELRDVMRTYHNTCADVVARFDGHIAQYLGDGLLVYFGYPVAHEDDGQRAVSAGLQIVEAVAALRDAPGAAPASRLAVRIGIHTGPVVVGAVGAGARHEQLALGETPNVAARVQAVAEPDTVVITAATHRLVQGLFVAHDLGARTLRGVSAPVRLYRVAGESAARGRLDGAAAGGLTPFVGRETEVALLLERWRRARDGQGQAVLLSGEPGIGKSRLARLLRERIADEPHTWMECRCSPYHQNTAFFPVIDLLHRAFRIERGEPDASRLAKVETGLASVAAAVPDAVAIYAGLLSIPLPAGQPAPLLSPEAQRQRTQDVLLRVLLLTAQRRPVLVVVEDLHWIDPSTLEVMKTIVEQAATARLLVVLTARPEFTPPWGAGAHVTALGLGRLPSEAARHIVAHVCSGRALAPATQAEIVARTDGIPLFVEELARTVLESAPDAAGDAPAGSSPARLAVPATLQDLLMARLDRLGRARETAHLAAVLGREFNYELLRAVSERAETDLVAELERLVAADLLHQKGVVPHARFFFRHALLQEAAYASLLRTTRQAYHARIAGVLEAKFRDVVETQPELLAHHYAAAGQPSHAIAFCHRAAVRALERSENVEATRHLHRGLELLGALAPGPERDQHELLLTITLGGALATTKGYAAPETRALYARAQELCRQGEETPERSRVLLGLFAFHLVRGEHRAAHRLGEQLLRLAETSGHPGRLLGAHQALGLSLFHLGRLTAARDHLERGIALYDPRKHRSHISRSGQDPGVTCLCYRPWVLWHLGHPDQALRAMDEVLAIARELAHPFSIAYALSYAVSLHLFRREPGLVQERAEELLTFARAQGFGQWPPTATVHRGWALAQTGRPEEGIAQMRAGLDAWRETGAGIVWPYYLCLLAEAHGQTGRPREGLAVIDDALGAVEAQDERWIEPELHRLRGVLALDAGGADAPDVAERCFRQALAVARRQEARALALRAATSLARLALRQDRVDTAREVVAELRAGLDEGRDTADGRDAAALLAALAPMPVTRTSRRG
jgi:TOMM system kinase/cyclase fusion protein